ncbi:MAG: RDD family protein [Ramlibacter sp.]
MSGALEYVGFWPRVGAALIDSVLLLLVLGPLVYLLYGGWKPTSRLGDLLFNVVLPCAITVVLWVRYGFTPGKYALSARVVDADTGQPLSQGRAVLRYFGYYLSIIPFCLGLIWVAFDRRKQGWHDKIANSVVVRPAGVEPVRFPKA